MKKSASRAVRFFGQLFRTAHHCLEPAAEVADRVDPHLTIDAQPLEDRSQLRRNAASLVAADLPPRPIRKAHVLGEADRQVAPVRGPLRRWGGIMLSGLIQLDWAQPAVRCLKRICRSRFLARVGLGSQPLLLRAKGRERMELHGHNRIDD